VSVDRCSNQETLQKNVSQPKHAVRQNHLPHRREALWFAALRLAELRQTKVPCDAARLARAAQRSALEGGDARSVKIGTFLCDALLREKSNAE
jgi:hypothetical protein